MSIERGSEGVNDVYLGFMGKVEVGLSKAASINTNKLKDPRILLVEPPNQFPPDAHRRPNGSLGPVCIGGALEAAGFSADFLDATVGTSEQKLDDVFYRQNEPNEKGLVQVGMTDQELAEAVRGYDIIAVTNIFTPQTTSSLRLAHIARESNPHALLLAGGINAWSLPERFFDAGFDGIGLGEGEQIMVDLATAVARMENWRNVPGVLHRVDGRARSSGMPTTQVNLDFLPKPAYDLWPLEKYWEASAPHGGDFPPGMQVRYASIETSRGCPFWCKYCHISTLKRDDGPTGSIGKLRLKSIDRVMEEVDSLKALGVEWLFFEDDSLLAKPERAMEIFRRVSDRNLNLADVNGVNLVHLYQRASNGSLEVREDLLETMVAAGFKQLVLPFESGSKRIIDTYASGKWNPETMDVIKLVKVANRLGLKVPGNFMIGFPDETPDELKSTVDLAKRLVEEGLTYASFFIVTPYPGSVLFDEALKNGNLDSDFDPDMFHWGNPVMKNTIIPPEELVHIRKEAWREVNNPQFVQGKLERQVIPEKLDE